MNTILFLRRLWALIKYFNLHVLSPIALILWFAIYHSGIFWITIGIIGTLLITLLLILCVIMVAWETIDDIKKIWKNTK